MLPVEILTLFLFLAIAYFPCNLTNTASVFFKSLLSLELCAFMSSSFGLLLSTLFSDAGVVMALVPVLIIPFLLVGGFFVPLETVPVVYYPFEYLSMFRYGYEGMIYSQYEGNPLVVNGAPGVKMIGTGLRYNFQVFSFLFRPPLSWFSSSWQLLVSSFESLPSSSCTSSVTRPFSPSKTLKTPKHSG